MGSYHYRTSSTDTPAELILGVGFFLIAAAVLLARQAPATGFESSIYDSTPRIVWGLIGAALVIAVSVAMYRSTATIVGIALALGGFTMTVVSALPIIRGYHFFGAADSLTHLGWTKDLAAGVVDPASLFYPAYHSLSLGLTRLLGVSPEHALLLAMVALFVPFLVFVPLTVWFMTGNVRAMAVAGIASWMVMPVNNVATHMVPHTNTLALFFVPVMLFATVAYLRQPEDQQGVTPMGGLLVVLSAAYVILHAQHAVNVLLVFSAICSVQFVVRRYRTDHPIANHRPLYAPTLLLGIFVLVWIGTHETATRAAQITFESLFRGNVGAVSEVAQRSGSLLAIGAGIVDIFAKLFLVSALFGTLTGLYLLLAESGVIDGGLKRPEFTKYLIVALVPLTILFAVYFLGTPKMAFRQFGFIFVIITIVSGAAGAWLLRATESVTGFARPLVTVLLVACLLVSLTTIFASPFIYKSSPGVSEQSMAGYETTLEHRNAAIPMATLTTDPTRYADAIYGSAGTGGMNLTGDGEGTVNSTMFNRGSAAAYPADSYYLALTESDIQTEIGVYNQLNFNQEAVQSIQERRYANRVLSNNEYDLYLVSNNTGS